MADWITVVDDDVTSLKMAGHILSKNNKRVTGLTSGQALLDYLLDNKPDLILLDIDMPGMDGFETLRKLKEDPQYRAGDIPVIFVTGVTDEEAKSLGVTLGVAGYIVKPFKPDELLGCIEKVLADRREKPVRPVEDDRDTLTGFIRQSTFKAQLAKICRHTSGYFLLMDIDNFALINDRYGTETGDACMARFAGSIRNSLSADCIAGRVGGDRYAVFSPSLNTEGEIKRLTVNINKDIVEQAKTILGPDAGLSLGISIGVVYVSGLETDFADIYSLAGEALHRAKSQGKHGYVIYNFENFSSRGKDQLMNLRGISMMLAEDTITESALQLDREAFVHVYRFVIRQMMRSHRSGCKLLFTLSPATGTGEEKFEEDCMRFCAHAKSLLRKNDLLMQYRKDQIFIFLMDIKEKAIAGIIGGIISSWNRSFGGGITITYEAEFARQEETQPVDEEHPWVVVVDDDISNLKQAGLVLSRNHMRVTGIKSGKLLLEFLKENRPDLILLDVNMPEMDGFETMGRLKTMEEEIADIPVIFLTGSEDEESEKAGLDMGATDFIRKPFVAEILVRRVKLVIEMVRLRNNLAREVAKKTRENESLFFHVVQSLADAIDAKDTYTNGHSGRVAKYSREIARRFGYNAQGQSDIYMMGLLHDVGKIGVPDEVINKQARLSDEEYELIKKHPVIGAQILKNIKEMPTLSVGARWHHERYDGKGYPDGLAGDMIPEAARIIAVADAYDAMTSYRSYRSVLPQEVVRREIARCSGTQFDPRFADIMIKMIDEDKDYEMKERKE